MRQRRCRYCKIYLLAKDLDYHINNECVNKLIKCGVENCDTFFQGRTQLQQFHDHENEHLQKNTADPLSGNEFAKTPSRCRIPQA